MVAQTFFCIDGHTCGNPVRVVAGGAPPLNAPSMMARREMFRRDYDWIRTGLMFEPRGHDAMSGTVLYPATREDCDIGLVFIETSGCLPMCGHGTIGTVTIMIERGLVIPRRQGVVRLDVPAGVVDASYRQEGDKVTAVRIRNVPCYLHAANLEVDLPEFGSLKVDVAYGGNFYAIIEPQPGYDDLDVLSTQDIQRLSPLLRSALNARYDIVHPLHPEIRGVTHIQWTGRPRNPAADGRNAVFYGDRGIDRSPCGTGTSARMAQRAARGHLRPGDTFVHESIIGSLFYGRLEAETTIADRPAIIPSIEGSAWITGLNTLFLDPGDPYHAGFLLP